jgi:hypothetical protein
VGVSRAVRKGKGIATATRYGDSPNIAGDASRPCGTPSSALRYVRTASRAHGGSRGSFPLSNPALGALKRR